MNFGGKAIQLLKALVGTSEEPGQQASFVLVFGGILG